MIWDYYNLSGRHERTGRPSRDTLERLGLEEFMEWSNWTEGHRFCLASSSRLSRKHFQQTACAFEGIFNAQLLLHQPDPRRNRMHDGNIQVLFHRDDILHLPRAGT